MLTHLENLKVNRCNKYKKSNEKKHKNKEKFKRKVMYPKAALFSHNSTKEIPKLQNV